MNSDEIRAWRQRMGFTQAQAARALCVSKSYVEMLEGGHRQPSAPLVALMECLEHKKAPTG